MKRKPKAKAKPRSRGKDPDASYVPHPSSVFADAAPNAQPCPVCLELAQAGSIQPRAVMPLPKFPPRSFDNRQCCRDCQSTEAAMKLWTIHPNFGSARLCIANERCETLTMPLGMAERRGLCMTGVMRPASLLDLTAHCCWLRKHGIPMHAGAEQFGPGLKDEEETE